ncbi:AGAP007738-PA-like protein [Anopheles sinensis]|uniref:AGAP007738-PA-like protein n=1 Tax=Anopheles sinensis TaxID=74873 RepID=A0A084WHE0_ANOSI|nr:AGAP007738-PA-like protein [Anopheles sinensis]
MNKFPNLARNFHSPRLEYNEWLPVGRGDPLKNDPTYDYSPPVLDRVRYWSEGSKDKSAGNDILLLGVPSKKSSAGPGVGKDWNSVPPVGRRNYFSHQPHGVVAPNQLPTVLMPPPLGNFLGGPDSGAGFWGGSAAGASQRVDNQPGEGFKYRSTASNFPLQGQYQGAKHPDPPISQPITAQFHHHHQPQAGTVAVGFNRQQQHPYVTTIRLTTPAGDTVKRPLLKTILQNEHSYPFTKTAMTSTVTEYTSGGFYDAQNINAMAQTIFHPPQTTEYLQPQPTKVVPKLNTDIRAPFVTPAGPFVTPVSVHHSTTTSTTTVRTTIVPSEAQNLQQQMDMGMHSSFSSQPVTTPPSAPPAMTTDTIFSHYKQPTTPERWSPYLIIEGHSKVKTYGLNTNDTLMQLPRMVPVASTKDPIVRHVVNRDPETGAEMGVTHLATTRRPPVYEIHTERTRPANTGADKNTSTKGDGQKEASAVDTLLTLLDSSPFGDMLKHDEAIGNTLDGAAGGKDSKTRRNVRIMRMARP